MGRWPEGPEGPRDSAEASSRGLWPLLAVLLALASPVAAQPVVQAQPLGALDLFQAGAADTGLPATLWRGTSATLARDVFDQLAAGKPLSPAARTTALALLRTGGGAPDGAAADVELAAARARALLALGDAAGVDAILDRTPGLAQSATLSEPAAEANLFLARDEDACAIAQALQAGRDAPYWIRLRAYCDAIAGRLAQAQLGFTLLEQQGARDEPFARLLGAVLAGEGANPGAASLRTGVHAALSRRLALDLAPAIERAAPAALAPLAGLGVPAEPVRAAATTRAQALGLLDAPPPTVEAGDAFGDALLAALTAVDSEAGPSSELVDRFVRLAEGAPKPARARAHAAALLLAAAGADVPGEHRATLMRAEVPVGDAAGARCLALDLAADAGRPGETGLVALDIALSAGAAGPKLADRIEIVRALREAGVPLWRAWAREGLEALQAAPR